MKVHCHYNITSKKHLRESKKDTKDEKKITKQKKNFDAKSCIPRSNILRLQLKRAKLSGKMKNEVVRNSVTSK